MRFIRRADVGDWRLKVYGIALPGREPRRELVDAALALARDVYPQPAVGDNRHGVGFVIVHDSATFGMALFYWWQSSNEIHQRHYLSPLDDVTALELVTGPAGDRLRLGARRDRLRAPSVDRGRPREPGRAGRRALPLARLQRRRLELRARRREAAGPTPSLTEA